MEMRIYIDHLISLTGNNTNNMVKTLIHEFSHKILATEDDVYGGRVICVAKSSKALASEFPSQTLNVADNWAFFYMSFGCYRLVWRIYHRDIRHTGNSSLV
jgi:hypothetical protein